MENDKMRVKESPRRVNGFPVVKSVFLGWLRDLKQEAGYFSFVLTYGESEGAESPEFQGHLHWSSGLDKQWRLVESWENMPRDMALAKFEQHEKLAAWPEGS